MHTQFEVERFLYREARLLDRKEFDQWLELFTDDVHYFMPLRRTRTKRELDQEFTQPGEMAWFDDNKMVLAGRVAKLATGTAWAEDPPSRTRHIITNVLVVEDRGDELDVESNFLLYRTRLKSEEYTWIGSRQDTLRRVERRAQDREAHDPARADRAAHAQPQQLLLTSRGSPARADGSGRMRTSPTPPTSPCSDASTTSRWSHVRSTSGCGS